MKIDWIAYGSIAILVMIWGGAFALTAVALEGFSPMGVASGRMALAALIVVPIAIVTGRGLPKTLNHWMWAGLLGVFNFAVPFMLVSWGQLQVPSSITAAYISAIPLFVLVFSRVILKYPVSIRRWIGFAIGFAGLIWLADPREILVSNAGLLPQLAIISATVGMAMGTIIIRLMPNLHPLTAIAGALIVGSIVSLPFGIGNIMSADASLRPLVGLLLLGLLPTGIAQVLRFFTVKRTSPVFVSTIGYLVPIWAGVLGVLFLHETIGLNEVIAYVLIVSGLLIARERRKTAPSHG